VVPEEIASMRLDFSKRPAARRAARASALVLASLAVPSSLVTGCLSYPNSDERLDDEIVITHYKNETEFGDYKTFSLSPEIVVFKEDDGEIAREVLDEDLAQPVLDQVEQNLADRGYTKVARDENPDLGITVSVLSGTVTGFYTDYWGYYWGYPYYPYYPYYYVYSYNTGTVVVDAADLKDAPPREPDAGLPPFEGDGGALGKLDVLWSGLVYGVLSSSEAQNVQRAVEGVDQAFKQSPYFRTSGD
jgi:hypothetical protein